jgi:membrane protease YdiL (CAAX protease family)
MTWVDHALAFLLAVVNPAASVRSASQLARRIASGEAPARLRYYAWGMAEYWAMALVLGMLWAWTGRPFAALGIVAPAGTAAWITAGLCVATVIFYAMQVRAALASAEARASLQAQIDQSPGMRAILPVSAAEMRGFAAAGVSAGICEELLYRGFMLWYLAALLPWGWAIAATVAIFGVGHAYQGAHGMLMTGVVGGVELAVYLWTGSLLAPIVMHVVIDLANGYIAYRAAGPFSEPSPASSTIRAEFDPASRPK